MVEHTPNGAEHWHMPARYGYCMVGSVVQSNATDLLPGTRAFCFHPHASHAIVPSSAAQIIPNDSWMFLDDVISGSIVPVLPQTGKDSGCLTTASLHVSPHSETSICLVSGSPNLLPFWPAPFSHPLLCAQDVSDEDAVFFANMETACALSQDAAPVIGESVAVFGAGTVGALTAAVLAHHGSSVTVFDPRADRLAALQRRFPKISPGGSATATAATAATARDFDVCIEASGSEDALASALQRCRRGGTVVIGAWNGMRSAS